MRVSKLRFMKVFPSKELDRMSNSSQPVEVTVVDDKFYEEENWWKYEDYLDIKFGRETSLFNLCKGCGNCCKNILKRNIRIYMSNAEIKRVSKKLNVPRSHFIEERIKVDGKTFGVVATDKNGDCIFLDGPTCIIHTDKPLWCKLWVCEKVQRRVNENRKPKK